MHGKPHRDGVRCSDIIRLTIRIFLLERAESRLGFGPSARGRMDLVISHKPVRIIGFHLGRRESSMCFPINSNVSPYTAGAEE